MTMPSNFMKPIQIRNPKLLIITIALVLSLHIGVGIGLMNMPALTVKPLVITPPLEISFLKPDRPVEPKPIVKIEPKPMVENVAEQKNKANPDLNTITKSESKLKVETTPQIQSKLETKTAPQPVSNQVEKAEKTNEPTPKSIQPAITPTEPLNNSEEPIQTFARPPEPFAYVEQQIDQQAILAEQAKEAEQKAQAENARLAKEQAEKQRLAQEKLAKDKADKERAEQEQAQRERLEREKTEKVKKDVENSKPVGFGNGNAQWRSKPNLSFSGNLARIIKDENLTSIGVSLNVSSSGKVTSVSITRSSGNSQIDNAVKQRLFSAKLKPFIRNGVAVEGVGNLTVNLD